MSRRADPAFRAEQVSRPISAETPATPEAGLCGRERATDSHRDGPRRAASWRGRCLRSAEWRQV